MHHLADYSSAPIAASDLKKAGFHGAVRYISPGREAWMKGKPLSKAEVEDFKNHGLELVSVWQYLKEDWRGGFKSGAENAKNALEMHKKLGAPNTAVIYFAIDSNPALNEWNNTVVQYIKGILSVLPKQQLGLYCNTLCHAWALEDGIEHYWWKHNWGSNPNSTAVPHIHQYEIDKASVAGVTIDRNKTYKEFYGQWSKSAPANSNTGGTTMSKISDLHHRWTNKWKTLVGGSFETTLGHYILLSDASSYRVEKKMKEIEEKVALIETLIKEKK